MTEFGVFGFDGPDAPDLVRRNRCNHQQGYNCMFLDEHAKLISYGRKWTTTPASGWPPSAAPQ